MATAKKDDITRLVKIKLFKDKDKYSEDVTVVVNGTTFRIQRGVEVEVHIMWLRYCVILKKQTRRQKQRFLS